ncbi:hypothetical protein EVAR_10965_1 [Eumeta japonica]|uniref:Uncharacterized protein n=1 Tax=Eumeta variegata TaxID=151549 RepID=A0A4C1U7I1_EUMVA|nr:hypothetical protein EVAR_10965_1 [Eumeta japonica]
MNAGNACQHPPPIHISISRRGVLEHNNKIAGKILPCPFPDGFTSGAASEGTSNTIDIVYGLAYGPSLHRARTGRAYAPAPLISLNNNVAVSCNTQQRICLDKAPHNGIKPEYGFSTEALGVRDKFTSKLIGRYLPTDSVMNRGRAYENHTFLNSFTLPFHLLSQKQNDLLQCACSRGAMDVAEYALSVGAKLQATDCAGDACLALAARGGHARLTALLLEKGADIDAVNKVSVNTLSDLQTKPSDDGSLEKEALAHDERLVRHTERHERRRAAPTRSYKSMKNLSNSTYQMRLIFRINETTLGPKVV